MNLLIQLSKLKPASILNLPPPYGNSLLQASEKLAKQSCPSLVSLSAENYESGFLKLAGMASEHEQPSLVRLANELFEREAG